MNPSVKIELNSIDIIATWKYMCKNNDCICNRPLYLPTVTEIDTNNIYTDNVIVGQCGHALHKSCLESYFKTCDNICPIDKLEWSSASITKPKYHIIDDK
jgi:hypothetical protein